MAKGDADSALDKLDVPQGTLDLMILTILAREPLHGYGISQRLTALSQRVVLRVTVVLAGTSGRTRRPSMMEKIAVFAPMPSASVPTPRPVPGQSRLPVPVAVPARAGRQAESRVAADRRPPGGWCSSSARRLRTSALGATRASVIRLVLGRVAILVGGGIVVGLATAAWASRFVATLLYGLEPGDPVTLVASAATLALIGALAAWFPAHHASRLDPTRVLRNG